MFQEQGKASSQSLKRRVSPSIKCMVKREKKQSCLLHMTTFKKCLHGIGSYFCESACARQITEFLMNGDGA